MNAALDAVRAELSGLKQQLEVEASERRATKTDVAETFTQTYHDETPAPIAPADRHLKLVGH